MENDEDSIEKNKLIVFIIGYFGLLLILLMPRLTFNELVSRGKILGKFPKLELSQFFLQTKIIIVGLIVSFAIIFNLFFSLSYAFLISFNFLSLAGACILTFTKDKKDEE